MPKRTQSYDAWQLEKLANPKLAAGYLNSALEESQEMFQIALRKVAQARQMAKVAREAGLQRETLYHALSEEGNPTLSTLSSVLSVLGLDLLIKPKKDKTVRSKSAPSQLVLTETRVQAGTPDRRKNNGNRKHKPARIVLE